MIDQPGKARILRTEANSSQTDQQFRALLEIPDIGRFSQDCVVRVRRTHIIGDTMNTIAMMGQSELRKPLRILFEGEPGVDEGGVRKEFFQLLIESLFSPDYGMFVYDPDTRLIWFNRNALEIDDFRLVGLIIGLAIYNNVILDLHFPSIIYARLLQAARTKAAIIPERMAASNGAKSFQNSSERLFESFGQQHVSMNGIFSESRVPLTEKTLEDFVHSNVFQNASILDCALYSLREVFPDQARSLDSLLEFEPASDVEDVLALSFSVDFDYYGEHKTDDLVENGRNIAVTGENRKAFALLYARYYLFENVRMQMNAFEQGFCFLMSPTAMEILSPAELEALVCGESFLDFEGLRKNTKYDGGYSESTPIVTWFWDVVLGKDVMTLEQRKKLLFFITGADRAPVGGLGTLRLIIQRAGPDDTKLPTAHTCFNVLLLPEYSSKEKLLRLLLIAIENAQGFGLQ